MDSSTLSVKDLFDRAIEPNSARDRDAFLDTACAAAPALGREVEDLLRSYDLAGGFLEGPTLDLGPAIAGLIAGSTRARIGPYWLLEPIGEGGMGTVYRAEHTRPVQRTVALNVIKPGMDSRQVLDRFETERQALALMDHPNIAREAESVFRDVIRMDSRYAPAYQSLANVVAESDRWAEADAALGRAHELAPGLFSPWYQGAVLRLYRGDVDGYRECCRVLRERFGQSTDPVICEHVATVLLLRPETPAEIAAATSLSARDMNGTEKHRSRPCFLLCDALAALRTGRDADALVRLRSLMPQPRRSHFDATTFAMMALAHEHNGQSQRARAALDAARDTLEHLASAHAKVPNPNPWSHRLIGILLCREAGGLLGPAADAAIR